MAQVDLSLSSKVQRDTGKSEVLIRFYDGSRFTLRAKSGVWVNPDYFEYYIDIKKTRQLGVEVPPKTATATSSAAARRGWALRTSGEIVTSNRRIKTPEVKYHEEQAERIGDLRKHILESYAKADPGDVTGDWLKNVVHSFNHPKNSTKQTFQELAAEYVSSRNYGKEESKHTRNLIRCVARFEAFRQATEGSSFVFGIDTATRDDLEAFFDYVANEHQLAAEYPQLFKGDFGVPLRIKPRGCNTMVKYRTRMKSLFTWAYRQGKTANTPFDGMEIGSEKFGTPYYISIGERNRIAATDMGDEWLNVQRDIFTFQCMVGCRVSDLNRLTADNIDNGVLVYTPHKTMNGSGVQARVPLHPTAMNLIKRYEGKDRRGRLFPFEDVRVYNEAIKRIFTKAGITRKVEVYNTITGETELKGINEIAASHIARRTFVGNAYFKVSDPNIIGKMSGHSEGSRAFSRYRKIEDETLKDVIDQLG